ncbi:hypothetical protein HDU97_009134 [Phlyctochytrium planicorne]|nr:hypothetical protein HDU97_009134 [Phlyctochytrium planicorne]
MDDDDGGFWGFRRGGGSLALSRMGQKSDDEDGVVKAEVPVPAPAPPAPVVPAPALGPVPVSVAQNVAAAAVPKQQVVSAPVPVPVPAQKVAFADAPPAPKPVAQPVQSTVAAPAQPVQKAPVASSAPVSGSVPASTQAARQSSVESAQQANAAAGQSVSVDSGARCGSVDNQIRGGGVGAVALSAGMEWSVGSGVESLGGEGKVYGGSVGSAALSAGMERSVGSGVGSVGGEGKVYGGSVGSAALSVSMERSASFSDSGNHSGHVYGGAVGSISMSAHTAEGANGSAGWENVNGLSDQVARSSIHDRQQPSSHVYGGANGSVSMSALAEPESRSSLSQDTSVRLVNIDELAAEISPVTDVTESLIDAHQGMFGSSGGSSWALSRHAEEGEKYAKSESSRNSMASFRRQRSSTGTILLADETTANEIITNIGKENGWTEDEIEADIVTLRKNRLRNAHDLRKLSKTAWAEIQNLLPVTKDLLRSAVGWVDGDGLAEGRETQW